jgi:hypothetical protein
MGRSLTSWQCVRVGERRCWYLPLQCSLLLRLVLLSDDLLMPEVSMQGLDCLLYPFHVQRLLLEDQLGLSSNG